MKLSNYPNLEVVWRKPEELKFYNRRARRHGKKQLEKLRASIRANQWINPLIIDENDMVLCGSGRLELALNDQMGLVPTIQISHMSEGQKRAYILADNRIAAEASWDRQLLHDELQGLLELGYDLELTGFDTLEIDTALCFDGSDVAAEAEDNVDLPEESTRVVSRLGDLWYVAEHRVLCGDARDKRSYEDLMVGELAQLVATDPPFGCPIAGNVSGLGKVKHSNFVMGAGEQSLAEFGQTLLRPAFRNLTAYAQAGAIAFICTDWRAAPYMIDAALGAFEELKNWIVWSKTNAGMGTFYRSAHEFILAYKVSPGKHINNFGLGEGGRHRSNVWVYPGANTFRKGRMEDLADHGTVKPKKMFADAILDCSKPGGIVLDAFLGSGTTLISCAMTGRIGRGIELDPKFVDVALRRLSAETGAEPLLGGVTPFSEVARARLSEEA